MPMDCAGCAYRVHKWLLTVPEYCARSNQPPIGTSNSVAMDLAMTGPFLATVADKALGERHRTAVAQPALLPAVATLGTVKMFATDTLGVISLCVRSIH